MLMPAITSKGTMLKVDVSPCNSGDFHGIIAFERDNPGLLPLASIRLGEIHKDSLLRIIAEGKAIRL